MLLALFFCFLVWVHGADEVFDLVDESLAVGETGQGEGLAAVRAFGTRVLDPFSQAALAGEFWAWWTHSGLFDGVHADIALEEGGVIGEIWILG